MRYVNYLEDDAPKSGDGHVPGQTLAAAEIKAKYDAGNFFGNMNVLRRSRFTVGVHYRWITRAFRSALPRSWSEHWTGEY